MASNTTTYQMNFAEICNQLEVALRDRRGNIKEIDLLVNRLVSIWQLSKEDATSILQKIFFPYGIRTLNENNSVCNT